MERSLPGIDAVTLEVIRNRLDSIVREMGEITLRTARSAVMYSGRDFSCGLLDQNAQLLALGTSMPTHIFPTAWQVQQTLDRFQNDVNPGDIFIGNDPFDGGTHLNDVLIFLPVYRDGRLIAFAANRAHWSDVGGMVPGSISGSAREIYQEGLRIPPIRLGENDQISPDILELILRNVRVPDETRADIMAQVASCRIGGQRIQALTERYALDTVLDHFQEVLESSARRMRAIISKLPKTSVSHEGYMDNDGVQPEQRRIRVTITTEGDNLHVDFSGTAVQSKGPLNVSLVLAHCFALIGVKAALDPSGPINAGCFRPIRVTAPSMSMLNAKAPAAAGGMGEVGQAAIFVLVALSKLVPHQVSAEEGASGNHQNLANTDIRVEGGRPFIYYDYPSGGGGGRSDKDGLDSVRSLRSGNGNISSIEVLENLFPIIFSRYELQQDSGGPGEFRGGLGVIREYRVPSDGTLSVLSDHAIIPPAGIFGGYSGAPSRWEVVRKDRVLEISQEFLSKVTAFPIQSNDLVSMSTPGGGGYGDPLKREPWRVRADLIDGKVSRREAERTYGVVFLSNTAEVDDLATRQRRSELKARSGFLLASCTGDEPLLDGGVRLAWVSTDLAERGVSEGDLAEVFAPQHPPALRLRLRFQPTLPRDTIGLDREALRMLEVSEGDRMLWRRLGGKTGMVPT